MKKFIAIVCSVAFLVACTPTDVTSRVAEVQAQASKLCAFVPTVGSVVAILTANPGVTVVSTLAQAICNAVTTKSVKKSTSRCKGYVSGVCVEGNWVR